MEKVFMNAGGVAVVVLCLVGLLKLPFKKFKETHPKWYKAVFTILSVVIGMVLCVLDELYLLSGDLVSFEFITLVLSVMAGVFGGYGGIYEGLSVKDLTKKLTNIAKKAMELSKDKKVKEFLNKIIDIDSAIKTLEDRKNQPNEV